MLQSIECKFDNGDVVLVRGKQRVILKKNGDIELCDDESKITLISDGNVAINSRDRK